MNKLGGVLVTLIWVSAAATASQPIAQVQLPCESRYQVLASTGTMLAVPCKDRSYHLLRIPEGTEIAVFPAARGRNNFVFSRDGQWLATGFEDGTVEVTSTRDSTVSKRWQASSHRIDILYFLPDNKTLFVGPMDSPGTIWELNNVPTLQATLPVEFGGISSCVASPDGKLFVAAGGDTVLRWYDTTSWQKIRENRGFLLETFALEFTPSGKQLLAGGADSRMTIFDAGTGKQLRQTAPEAGAFITGLDLLGAGERVLAVYVDDAGEKPPHALVWDLASDNSTALKTDSQPTCGAVVNGRLQVCSLDGRKLTISEVE